MSGPVGVAGDQLRAIVERIEHVEDEIKELTEARKEIYLEAKGNGYGFDVKILREVIRMRSTCDRIAFFDRGRMVPTDARRPAIKKQSYRPPLAAVRTEHLATFPDAGEEWVPSVG